MSLIDLVLGLFILFVCLSITSVAGYLYLKRLQDNHNDNVDAGKAGSETLALADNLILETFKWEWLSIVESQQLACVELIEQRAKEKKDSDFTLLLCWKTFLDIEYETIEQGVPYTDIESYLDVFQTLVNKVDKALEIESLQKNLQEQKKILVEAKKANMNSADALSHSLDTSAKLKLALDTFQLKVMHEADLDVDLAKVREQIARISSVRDAVQNKLDEMDSESDLEPIGHLELFLNSMESPPFLESMESELAEKVSDLKRIASEQLKTIQMLQKENKEMKLGEANQRLHSGNDVLIVRLEKILLDQNRSVKTLENKLNSLHTIRHNLNIDLTKKEEVIDYKGKMLEERSDSSDAIVNMKGLIERKHETMQSMEDLLHSIPLTAESDEYSTEQGKRLSELRLMVSESELYVEMLERDLDSVHEKREQYELILSQQNEDGLAQNGDDQQAYSESLSRLQVLEKEASELQLTLTTNLSAISRVKKMTAEIDEMEEKIEAVTAKYVELEEKYLTTLIM